MKPLNFAVIGCGMLARQYEEAANDPEVDGLVVATTEIGSNPGAPVVAIRINDDWKSWKFVRMQNGLNRKVGLLLSEGTHFADLATWFLESEPVSAVCVGLGALNHAIVISYANGGLATTCWRCARPGSPAARQ
jgi:predicted dehydrogenase